MAGALPTYRSMLGAEPEGPIRGRGANDRGRLVYIRRWVWDPEGSTPLDPGGHWEGGLVDVDDGVEFPDPTGGPLGGPGGLDAGAEHPGSYVGSSRGPIRSFLYPPAPRDDKEPCPRYQIDPTTGPPYRMPCTEAQGYLIKQAFEKLLSPPWSTRLKDVEDGNLYACMLRACKDIFFSCEGTNLSGPTTNPEGYEQGFVTRVDVTLHPNLILNAKALEAFVVYAAVLMCGGMRLDARVISELNGFRGWKMDDLPDMTREEAIERNPDNVFWGRYVWVNVESGLAGLSRDNPYDYSDVVNAEEMGRAAYNRRWYCPACVI